MILGPIVLGCVDKIELSLPTANLPIIVAGMITDQPGPDTVKILKAFPADGKYHPPMGVTDAKVAVVDGSGFVDSLVSIGNGKYLTGALDGVVGQTYQLFIRFADGTEAVSTPQLMVEAGTIDSIFYEYTTYIPRSTGFPEDAFNIYVNATLRPESNHTMRWRFFGTYTATTDPASIRLRFAGPTGTLEMGIPCAQNCECCMCWYTTFEKAPIVSSPKVSKGSKLDRVFIQQIPINRFTFFERYRIEIWQMELSEEVHEYYQTIRKQIDNTNSLFQPPFFDFKGNVTAQNGPIEVIGTFAAAAVSKREIFIYRSAVPYQLPNDLYVADCRAVADNSTLTRPAYWQ